ncbi:MAG TPA: hypothetical protein VG329_03010 [Candidatus Dormibacteraeota bacterium]|nr:hypothetical protein [Candidatus Dormibacteraeota bacterium]
MAQLPLPHQASYTILDPAGADAGSEELTVNAFGAGLRVTSRLRTDYPVTLTTTLDWELDARLVTRRLLLQSRTGWGDECELELTVTGNGLLAHRLAPDGPTQVELGWGPQAELDHLSAAFPMVMAARTELNAGESRRLETIYIGAEDLILQVVARELTAVATEGPTPDLLSRALDTGHAARLTFDPTGALRSYEGLLRLERLSLLPAPTK